MALTVNVVARRKLMNGYEMIADVEFDDSYATGGLALGPSDVGLRVIDFVNAPASGGYVFEYDYAAQKLKALVCDDGNPMAEVSASTDLSSVKTRVMVVGY